MKSNDTQQLGHSLKKMADKDLDRLLAHVLQEMRRRDSDHVKGDVINGTQQLRKLRSTSSSAKSALRNSHGV